MVSFILSTTLTTPEIVPQRDLVKSQLLRQFSFTKILNALHTFLNIYSIFEEPPTALIISFFVEIDRLTLSKRT